MRAFFRHQLPRLVTGYGLVTLALVVVAFVGVSLPGLHISELLASATSSLSNPPAILYFTPYGGTAMSVGSVTSVDVNINARVPINAIGITIKFPPDLLEVVGVSKEKSFIDLWTEDTAIREMSGEVHFSGGTELKGGLTGTSTGLTLTVRAKSPGDATLSFEDTQVLASDGAGSNLANRAHDITFHITAPSSGTAIAIATPSKGEAVSKSLTAPLPPNPDFNDDGKVTLVDMSILILHMMGGYDARYDLNSDGAVNIADLSALISKVQL